MARLTILGGGGFRVPLVHAALLADRGPGRITELVLHDVDSGRLAAVGQVIAERAAGAGPRVTATTDLDAALRGADFVFSAIRVGGLAGRAIDEGVALAEGVLGQETVGAGGVAYGLRTVPVAVDLARRIATVAPDAWVVNFTNPAGLVTEAMAAHLGDRVIGICDSPVGLARRAARALGVDPSAVRLDYAGLNHLGWLRGLYSGGVDLLPRLLADDAALASFEEGRLFGGEWLRALGALPNEYLHYHYFAREALAAARTTETRATEATAADARTGGETRGAQIARQQAAFYAGPSLAAWEEARLARERTYREARDAADLEGGGYEGVALALMRALGGHGPATLILNVRNRATLPALDAEAVVEVPCAVDVSGARPLPVAPLDGHAAGLVTTVKAVERAVLEAATSGSRAAALRAFALHPLVDSVAVARRLLDAYIDRHGPLSYLRGDSTVHP
ncbi:6-phospho-beta-glucosidase [Phytohabitans kaempferiae]|uniref:6-phospho-beta-glucosidase n=1 Tax=Phytohabitans kaempferiae TaxID=1620943 RepID=A0ABV6M442_9ACTN